MTCVVVWNVVELGILIVPVEIWRTTTETVLHLQWFVVLDVVHQIEVAHLIVVGSTVSGEEKLFLKFNRTTQNQYLPNVGDGASIALHGTPRCQAIPFADGCGTFHWIKHLRRQWVPFAQSSPMVLALFVDLNLIAGHDSSQTMGMGPIGERVNGFIFANVANRFHVFNLIRRNGTTRTEQQHARSFVHPVAKWSVMLIKCFQKVERETHCFKV